MRRAVTYVLRDAGIANAEISVTFLADIDIQVLNKSYLGHDWPTDVLTFTLDSGPTGGPMADPAGGTTSGPTGEAVAGEVSGPTLSGVLLGDLYIGAERAREQAMDRGIPIHEEGLRLAVHGALHLTGKDHPEGPDREDSPFFAEQERWVSRVLAEEEAT